MHRPRASRMWIHLAVAMAAAALSVTTLALPAAAAGQPSLVKDINPGGSSNPTELTKVGNTLFFAANDGVHGTELWKSDGTGAGTKMVKNIRPYGKSSNPQNLVNVNGTLFFTANDGTHKTQLWKSDGTTAGTKRVSNIINHAYDSSYGLALALPAVVGSRLFFFNLTCCVGTQQLYVSDGTSAGTRLLTGEDTVLTLPDQPTAAAYSGRFYFVASSMFESARVVWVSNGTVSGTHPLGRSPQADEINILPASGQSLYFVATTGAEEFETHAQLWKTNGTTRGTRPLTSNDELRGSPRYAAYMSKRLYFGTYYWDAAQATDFVQLWKTNGSPTGTRPILTMPGSWIGSLTKAGDRLFFVVDGHLWKTDGTAAGNVDLGYYPLWPTNLIGVNGRLCFTQIDGDTGNWSLWRSAGSASGTYPVRSFVAAAEEMQQAAVGNRLLFAANDGKHGAELWSYVP